MYIVCCLYLENSFIYFLFLYYGKSAEEYTIKSALRLEKLFGVFFTTTLDFFRIKEKLFCVGFLFLAGFLPGPYIATRIKS